MEQFKVCLFYLLTWPCPLSQCLLQPSLVCHCHTDGCWNICSHLSEASQA